MGKRSPTTGWTLLAPPRNAWQGGRATPFRIVLAYATLASLWILLSDRATALIAPGTQSALVQTVKGLLFVGATSALLLLLIRRHVSAATRAGHELRAILESMSDAVLVLQPPGELIGGNGAALALFGLDSGSVPRLPLDALERQLVLRDGSRGEHPLQLALEGRATIARDVIVRRPDGTELAASLSVSPVRRNGEPGLAVAVLRDVTELRALEHMRDEFLSTAAHELKTPIAALKGYVQLLRKWAPESASPREKAAYDVLNRQCDRITRLVQEMLEVSRLRLGRPEIQREPVDLGALVQEVAERMQVVSPAHTLHVRTSPGVHVPADRDRIDQVVVNLLDNAVRFSPGGGAITVHVDAADGEAEVSVTDDGVGIPRDRTEHVFEAFYQAHAGTAYHYQGGLGIGLHISREIIRRHGGRIWFESEEGKGSTFHFSLPLAAGAPDERQPQDGAGSR